MLPRWADCCTRDGMTNRIALWLGALIVLAIAADLWFQTGAMLFGLRKFTDLVEYLAFWR